MTWSGARYAPGMIFGKHLSAILALLLIATLPNISTAATIKPGMPCKKLNAISQSAGSKLVCKKIGKKWVWSVVKISSIKALPIAPVEGLTPAPVPTAQPVPTKTPEPLKTLDVEPTGPASPITFDNLDVKWTSVVARAHLLSEFAKLPIPESKIKVISGPTVVTEQLEEERRLLLIAERMFSKYFSPDLYQVIYFSEKDGAWADQALKTYGGSYPNSISQEILRWPAACNFAFATIGKQSPIYYQCMDTRGRSINDKQTPIHEYFHLVQQKYQMNTLPCWLLEGSATYFGIALGVDGADPTGRSGNTFINNLSYAYNPGGSINSPPNTRMHDLVQSEDGVLKLMTGLELIPSRPEHNCISLGAYTAGGIATEALIATKGLSVYMEFMGLLRNGKDWRENFSSAYGISPTEFYMKLAPYLKSRI